MSGKKGELTHFKVKKRKINKMRLILLIIVGIVIAYFVGSALKIVRLTQEKAEVEQKNQQLKETIEDMNQELDIIHSDQYMERLARKRLKLVRANEILFILPNLRTNEDDEEVGPMDMAQQEALDMVEAKKAEDAKKAEEEAAQEEADKDKKNGDQEDQDKSGDAEKSDNDSGENSEGDKDGGQDG